MAAMTASARGVRMRPNVAQSQETLDAAALPRHDNTELNHRTCVTTFWQDALTVARLLFVPTLLATPIVLVASILAPFSTLIASSVLGAAGFFVLVAFIQVAFSGKMPSVLSWIILLATCGSVAAVMGVFTNASVAYLLLFSFALACAYVFSYYVAKQAAFWMTAHPQLKRETTLQWQDLWPPPDRHYFNSDFPESIGFSAGAVLLLGAWIFGFAAQRFLMQTAWAPAANLLSILVFMVAVLILWQLVNLSGTLRPISIWSALTNSCRALRIFCCYNRHETPAIGVFRFPSRWLRPVVVRDSLLFATLVLFVMAIAAMGIILPAEPPPSQAASKTEPPPEIEFDQFELDWLASLAPNERATSAERLQQEKLAPWRARQAAIAAEARQESKGQLVATLSLALALVGTAVAAPPVLLLLTLFATSGHLLSRYYDSLEAPGAPEQSDEYSWKIAVERMIRSNDADERNHLLLGTSVLHDYPVLLHRELLKSHGHITGDTGAHKTSYAIGPLAAQLIATDPTSTDLDCSVVIIDLKGEDWLFHATRDAAQKAGRKFRWFTIVPDDSSYVFNPFTQSHWSQLSPEQCTQVILQALSLDYGIGYGRGFFSAMNETVLLRLLREYEINSFEALYRKLEDSAPTKAAGGQATDLRDARHLTALVNRLSAAHALNLTEQDLADKPEAWDNAIDMPTLFDESQVVYFTLPSPLEPVGAPAIAKLALYSLFTAAAQRTGKRKQVYVFIDEFQQVISDSIKLILEQARSKGVSLILAHQTTGQLDRNGTDLAETVDSCTAFKQNLKASDTKAAKRLAEGSGEASYQMFNTSYRVPPSGNMDNLMPETVDVVETIRPRLEPNTIIEVSADSSASMVRFTEGSGYTQFSGYWTIIDSQYHQTPDEFEVRSRRDWPAEDGQTVRVLGEQIRRTAAAAQAGPRRRGETNGSGEASPDEPAVISFADALDKKLRPHAPQPQGEPQEPQDA
ncbi:MAG: TraM recognition domain-containing protein [Pirellulales bacterium]|nr:TraM recognition domain-containing protein [Pirellulales bacterium]